MAFARDIDTAQDALEACKTAYVKRWGWVVTCNTPGAYWLWRRDFEAEDLARHASWRERGPGPLGWPSEPRPYGVITADLDLAVSITRRFLDECPEDNEDACGICAAPFAEGDPCLTDVDLGSVHAACCGPERESYVGPDGEPLKDGQPIPTPWIWSAAHG